MHKCFCHATTQLEIMLCTRQLNIGSFVLVIAKRYFHLQMARQNAHSHHHCYISICTVYSNESHNLKIQFENMMQLNCMLLYDVAIHITRVSYTKLYRVIQRYWIQLQNEIAGISLHLVKLTKQCLTVILLQCDT